jgi:hypothetical protein
MFFSFCCKYYDSTALYAIRKIIALTMVYENDRMMEKDKL